MEKKKTNRVNVRKFNALDALVEDSLQTIIDNDKQEQEIAAIKDKYDRVYFQRQRKTIKNK